MSLFVLNFFKISPYSLLTKVQYGPYIDDHQMNTNKHQMNDLIIFRDHTGSPLNEYQKIFEFDRRVLHIMTK